jgi:TPR repeat protein
MKRTVFFISLFVAACLSATAAQPGGGVKSEGESLFDAGNTHLRNKEYSQAVYCLEKSAKMDFAKAKLMLGNIYAYGWTGLVQYKISSSWYLGYLSANPADSAVPSVHFNLGYMYLHGGFGLIKDEQEGLKWLKLSAAEGYGEAKDLLNKMGLGEDGKTDTAPSSPEIATDKSRNRQ